MTTAFLEKTAHDESVVWNEWAALQAKFYSELRDWNLRIAKPSSGKAAGTTNFPTKTVNIAPWAVNQLSLAQLLDTIRHEAAHCIAGASARHGPLWKAACYRTGANPSYGFKPKTEEGGFVDPGYKFLAICPTHGVLSGWLRAPKATSKFRCPKCKQPIEVAINRKQYLTETYPKAASLWTCALVTGVAQNLPKHTYEITLPDGRVSTTTSTRDYHYAFAALVDETWKGGRGPGHPGWSVFSIHGTKELAERAASQWRGFGQGLVEVRVIPVDNPRPVTDLPTAQETSNKCPASGMRVYQALDQFPEGKVPGFNYSAAFNFDCPACGAYVKQTRQGTISVHKAAKRASRVDVFQSDPEFAFHFTATWRDVQAKAKRIHNDGHVRVISSTPAYLVGEVRGDTDIYQTTLAREGTSKRIAMWECGCAWASYSWGRSGRWKKYEGRMCSHALALNYEGQSRGWGGQEITEDTKMPKWRSDPSITVKVPGDYKKPEITNWRLDAKRAVKGIDTCKFCGSEQLFDAYFDEEGYAVTNPSSGVMAEPDAEWKTVCQDCGEFQDKARRKKKALWEPPALEIARDLLADGLSLSQVFDSITAMGCLNAPTVLNYLTMSAALGEEMGPGLPKGWFLEDITRSRRSSPYATLHYFLEGETKSDCGRANRASGRWLKEKIAVHCGVCDRKLKKREDAYYEELERQMEEKYGPKEGSKTAAKVEEGMGAKEAKVAGIAEDLGWTEERISRTKRRYLKVIEGQEAEIRTDVAFLWVWRWNGFKGALVPTFKEAAEAAEAFAAGDENVLHSKDLYYEGKADEAILHDEPEPALPSTTGEEEEPEPEIKDEIVPGDPRLAWIMKDTPKGKDEMNVADAARTYLAKTGVKNFTAEERRVLIEEGEMEGVVASNLDRLDISGTHYEPLEEAYQAQDAEWWG